MRPLSHKATRKRSQRQELELAEDTGGRIQKGSGCLPWAKGDVRKRDNFRAECKFTRSKSFTVTRAILDKIRSECAPTETPVLDITFAEPTGRTGDRWVAIPYSAWLEYQQRK